VQGHLSLCGDTRYRASAQAVQLLLDRLNGMPQWVIAAFEIAAVAVVNGECINVLAEKADPRPRPF
jgi:hypothetical protein